MPTHPPASPTDPLVRRFIRHKSARWSTAYVTNATSILNRWTAWLDARGVELTDAQGEDCAEYLAARRAGTTGLIGPRGEPVGPVVGATLHKDWQLLRWLYRWLSAEGELPERRRRSRDRKTYWVAAHEDGPMADIDAPTDLEPDPENIRHISERDYRRLMGSFGKTSVLDCRNAVICSLMYRCGVRMSEVARCDLERYDAANGVLWVYGKNHEWRPVVLMTETRDLMDRYLYRRRRDPAVALFASSLAGNEADTTGRLRSDAIAAMLERRSERLGISVTAHQFRRAATIEAKRRGVGETEIARQLGWSDSSSKRMIPRYTQSDADRLTADVWRATDPTAAGGRRARLRAV